jgi:hypothetical protein
MRVRTWLVSISAFVAAAGTVACSSDDNATAKDSGGTGMDSTTTTDTGGGGDTSRADTGGNRDASDAAMEAAPCVPVGSNTATFDAGDPQWTCIQANCADAGLPGCAAECACNDAIYYSLQCVVDAGRDAMAVNSCFTYYLTPLIAASDPAATPAVVCLQLKQAMCAPGSVMMDGGPDADSGDAPSDAPADGG